ncbi:MAG TPA: xanthine dehydrogenase accessory protein XdhC [Casimicrobiaceae bacterium]|nr:xanthine dehydrogenase accessory protein XdhC [Casimicrobiaceae bacterium]
MSDWIAPLRSALAAEGRAILVTLAAARGSTPREVGARMIVTSRATHGSIGGGHLEFEATRIAREGLVDAGSGAWLARFPLAARLGQCCGGVATVLFQRIERDSAPWVNELAERAEDNAPLALVSPIAADAAAPLALAAGMLRRSELPPEPLAAAERMLSQSDAAPVLTSDGRWFVERIARQDFRVLLFGNGHVGRALVQVLGTLPCAVTWIDEREDDFPANVPPNVTVLSTDAPEDEVRRAAPGSMFLVMTHSHALDLELARAILAREDFDYFGLIGSASKRAQFERRLGARGLSQASIARMTCPIGVAGIRSKSPGAIAVAVAAELLQLRARNASERKERAEARDTA